MKNLSSLVLADKAAILRLAEEAERKALAARQPVDRSGRQAARSRGLTGHRRLR